MVSTDPLWIDSIAVPFMSTFLAWCAALLLLPLVVLLWITESPAQRVSRWRVSGLSEQEIASRSQAAMRQVLILHTVEA
jgi:hypothetical protein